MLSMATAISPLVILTLSVIAVRVGGVALWLRGLPEHVARFQARSAFTTTGFTTPQASFVVNHPERRRIISVLMVLGNAGVVSVMATVILSYVDFEASVETLAQEALWPALAAAATFPVLRGLDACFRSGSLALHTKA
jgi:Trk-type K+ transport system membrane component